MPSSTALPTSLVGEVPPEGPAAGLPVAVSPPAEVNGRGFGRSRMSAEFSAIT